MFPPVTNKITLRILTSLSIIEDYFAEIVDVQIAFLYGNLEEEIFIKIHPGYYEFLRENGEKIEGNYLQYIMDLLR